MSKKPELKPLAVAVGAILATSAFTIPTASANENPFKMTELSSGYMVAGKEGKCGMKMMDADEDGAVSKDEFMQHHQEKFTKKDKNADGKLTNDEMMMKEGKCGEGKCGEK